MSSSYFDPIFTIWWHEDTPPDLDKLRNSADLINNDEDREEANLELDTLEAMIADRYVGRDDWMYWQIGPIQILQTFDNPFGTIDMYDIIHETTFYELPAKT